MSASPCSLHGCVNMLYARLCHCILCVCASPCWLLLLVCNQLCFLLLWCAVKHKQWPPAVVCRPIAPSQHVCCIADECWCICPSCPVHEHCSSQLDTVKFSQQVSSVAFNQAWEGFWLCMLANDITEFRTCFLLETKLYWDKDSNPQLLHRTRISCFKIAGRQHQYIAGRHQIL